ncbi:MAG: biopolymer transporter ExbD [Bacteroidetes bacterium]|jgi:biopolymer transport protein ExbD|nr:biopolymer transporter ExbD [Bacteroidota bacterium]
MQLRRKQKEGAEVFTDSLNDIMFFLLLFFIILSTMANRNSIKLELPSSKSVQQVQAKQILLQVDANHNYFVNGLPITIDQIEPVLMAESKAKQNNNVTLVLDKSLSIQDLADIMQIGSKLNLKMVLSAKTTK